MVSILSPFESGRGWSGSRGGEGGGGAMVVMSSGEWRKKEWEKKKEKAVWTYLY